MHQKPRDFPIHVLVVLKGSKKIHTFGFRTNAEAGGFITDIQKKEPACQVSVVVLNRPVDWHVKGETLVINRVLPEDVLPNKK